MNIPATFDIETTNFRVLSGQSEEKRAVMYAWTFGINGQVFFGRTWDEFIDLLDEIKEYYGLDINHRIIIYVHNLSYEFHFICHYFEWSKVFASEPHKPIYALTVDGIEFRCSYFLSNYNLETVGEQLTKYKVEKLVGNLDYSKMRHSKTPMTESEVAYCIHDSLVVMAYIQESIEREGNISLLPLTNTGYVRRMCRENCLAWSTRKKEGKKDYYKYRNMIKNLTLTPEQYKQIHRAFMGGFTHAAVWWSGKTLEKVSSFDITSSYPTVMVSEKFPMSKFVDYEPKSVQDLEKYCNRFSCVFDVRFYNIEIKDFVSECALSVSKCYRSENVIANNGRVMSADIVHTTITDVDYWVLKSVYDWERMDIADFRYAVRWYLPRPFVMSVLQLYGDKTRLKGVSERIVEYNHAKGMTNATYGMTVTDINRDEIDFDTEWKKTIGDVEENIARYNKQGNRFLYYPWGVWVTAYARANLFKAINEFREDYIYSDTDSIKCFNAENHKEFFDNYNSEICRKIETALSAQGIPVDMYKPCTIEGEEKPLGVWDYEGEYIYFKTLGAKRYMTYSYNRKKGVNELKITVAGLNKKDGAKYIWEKSGHNPIKAFNLFSEGLYIPPDSTGKLTHTYMDHEIFGIMIDYMGNPGEYHELSYVQLEPQDYELSLSDRYAELLRRIANGEQIKGF